MNLLEINRQLSSACTLSEQVLLESDDDEISVPGHDMSDPSHSKFLRELNHYKRTDIKLYRKIISGH